VKTASEVNDTTNKPDTIRFGAQGALIRNWNCGTFWHFALETLPNTSKHNETNQLTHLAHNKNAVEELQKAP